MKHADRETLRRVADFNRTLAADATNALEHGDGEITSGDVRALARRCCDFGMDLWADADQRDAVDGTYIVGAIRRLPTRSNDDRASDS